MEMNKMEKMDKIWKILMDTRIEIIKARFKYSEYAETYALNYDEAFNHYDILKYKFTICLLILC